MEKKLKLNQRCRKYYSKNKEKILKQKREYYLKNIVKIKNRSKEYHLKNQKTRLEYQIKYRKENKAKINARVKLKKYGKKWLEKNKDYNKNYYHKNKHRFKERVKKERQKWYAKNKEKVQKFNQQYRIKNFNKLKNYQNIYRKNKRKNDPKYKLSVVLRTRFRDWFKKGYKNSSVMDMIGCDLQFLKNYLESLFQPGMTWKNHGYNGWHIDHIKPLNSFNILNADDIKKAWHYTNLQPLWAKDNLRKGKKI